ncbi:hypothetical protein C8R47DRAFT_1005740 [Mycena vitilis]|nr:hypothetical protein C8R47DRAFT_1005740 [Mycena vitilis]
MNAFSLAQTLPPEVVDFIADGNRGNRKALASSSLVCKAWLQSSRYHLFSEFDIYVGPARGASFLKLLRHPLCTLVYCIRKISIYPGQPDQLGVAGLGDKTVTGLSKLQHVSSLRIHNHRGSIPSATLALLASAFPEVTTLRLTNGFSSFKGAIEFVTMFPMLKSLDFYPHCVDASPTALPGTAPPPNLGSVTLHSPLLYSSWFTEHCGHFQSFTLSDLKSTDSVRLTELLKALGASLRNLSLRFSAGSFYSSAAIPVSFDFGPLEFTSSTRLSSLELEIPKADLTIFLQFLRHLCTASNLCVFVWTGSLHLPDVFSEAYTEIDKRLADRAAFKSLKEVHFISDGSLNLRETFPKADAVGIVMSYVDRV